MMHLSWLDILFWAASFPANIALLLVLVYRRRAESFPVFTSLIVFNIARTALLYFIYRDLPQRAYFNVYHVLAVCDELLQLGVVYELATHVFRPTGTWAPDIRRAFAWLAAASVGVAGLLTWLAEPPTRLSVQTAIIRCDFFSSALMVELFVCMMVLSATAGLPWKTHVARIAQGFGAYSFFGVVLEAFATWFGVKNGTHAYATLSHIRIAGSSLCRGYWIVTLWQDAPAPQELPEALRMQIYTLQRQVEYDLIRIRSWRRS